MARVCHLGMPAWIQEQMHSRNLGRLQQAGHFPRQDIIIMVLPEKHWNQVRALSKLMQDINQLQQSKSNQNMSHRDDHHPHQSQ